MKSAKELLELLAQAPKVESEESQQEKFLRTMGAEHHETDRVGADILYYTYLLWKEELGEVDVLERWQFFRGDYGFPAWVKRTVCKNQTKYWLPKHLFPVTIDTKLEMRKLWRGEKQFTKRSKQVKRGLKQKRQASKKISSPK